MANRKFSDADYLISGRALETIWREIYTVLIEDDGTPKMAIRGDRRRDMAQRLGALLEHAWEMPGQHDPNADDEGFPKP